MNPADPTRADDAPRSHTYEEIRAWLVAHIAAQAGTAPEAVDPTERFRRLGLDSKATLGLLVALGERLGRALSPTLAWEHPTPDALARHLGGAAAAPVLEAPGGDADEPIAVVGLACRFPGAPDPEAYWRLLRDGVDAISETPRDRWDVDALFDPDPAAPGRLATRWGGFLADVAGFDAAFFGVSPREAEQIDPQQRLALELAWEALEDARVAPAALRDTRTGVFLGAMWADYARLAGAEDLTLHSATGQDLSIVPARVSYTLGLLGPSLAVNTACSSSLVAVHLARQSLLRGETRLALAGGVNLLLAPESTVAMTKFGAMAPDGRSKAFDARANGYVRGEGGGVVALKRLSHALADGDRVYCVIRGSAVNNDGFSNGLTAPSPRAQELVLRDACAAAGVAPGDVQYVEAHGTGTLLGDPIEAGALGAVLGAGRTPERALRIGSVKTNVGHLEAAAGVAGLIKVALAMRRGELPPSLHFEHPNPHIPFERLGLRVQAAREDWAAEGGRRLAGVSSFGFGGTNAHVVLEAPAARAPRVAMLFSGHGAQWAGMGRRLYETQPAFRAALDRCFALFDRALPRPLRDVMWAAPGAPEARLLDQLAFAQPALFALQYALAALWQALGVRPAVVLGHSSGEIAAACVAGVLSLEDGVRLVAARGTLIGALPEGGAMVYVGAGEDRVRPHVAPVAGRVAVAAVNGPDNVVLSGVEAEVLAVAAALAADGVQTRRLAISHASHSPLMAPMRDAFRRVAESLAYGPPRVALVSCLDGRRVDGATLDAAHWVRHVEAPVRFADGVAALAAEGVDVVLEVGPASVLCEMAVVAALGVPRVASLDRHAADDDVLREGLARLFVAGAVGQDGSARGAAAAAAPALAVLSGRTEAALAAQARRLRAHLDAHPDVGLGDVAWSLATTRTHHDHRLAVVAPTRAALATALDAAARGERRPDVARGVAPPARARVAFVFTGQGAQVAGMGRALHAAWPAFRDAFDACVARLDAALGASLRDVVWAAPGTAAAARLDDTAWAQPALFALEYALAAQWRAWGVAPDVVAGHSLGELVAACVAGVFSLDDAARLVAARGQLMGALPPGGAMVAVAAPEADVAAAVAPHTATAAIAAVNAPDQVVVSGDAAAVAAIAAGFAARGVATRALRVSHAFHAPAMDPMLAAFARVAATVAYRAPSLPLVSAVTGAPAGAEVAAADYWVRHARATVRWADAVRALHAAGAATVVEVGPQPTLLGLVAACLPGAAPALVPSVRPGRDEAASALAALGALWARGAAVDWAAAFPAGGRRVDLPIYPWQRERFWIGRAAAPRAQPAPRAVAPAPVRRVVRVGPARQPYLADHVIFGRVIVPGAFYAATIVAVAAEVWPGRALELRDVAFVQALALAADAAVDLHVTLTPEGTGYRFELATQADDASRWTVHARGAVAVGDGAAADAPTPDALAPAPDRPLDAAEAVARLAAVSIGWGPRWNWIRGGRVGDGAIVTALVMPADGGPDDAPLHPALLDNGFISALLLALGEDGEDAPRLPFAVERLRWWRAPAGPVRCGAARRPSGAEALAADVALADAAGVFAEVRGFVARRAPREVFLDAERAPKDMFRVEWRASGTPPAPAVLAGAAVLVAATTLDDAEALAAALRRAGAACATATLDGVGAALDRGTRTGHVVCLWPDGDPLATTTTALAVVQALAARDAAARLWWVTRGAVAVGAGEDVALGAAPLWGLGRVVMQEHPALGCRLVDLGPETDAAAALTRELASPDDEAQVAWRAGRRHVARLAPVAATPAAARSLRRDGTVLVTGGLGALGLHVARWLAAQGVAHVVLAGRRGAATPGAAAAVAALEAQGTRVTVAALDVTDGAAVAALVAALPADVPLRGVVHAAGARDDGVLAAQTGARLARGFAAKVRGAAALADATRGADLDAFVVFSSVAATLGLAGQGPYAAANAWLDAWAHARRARGLAAQSLAWGPWADAGMAADLAATYQARIARLGMRPLTPDQGIALLEQALASGDAHLVPVAVDPAAAAQPSGATIWRALAPAREPAAASSWADRLASLPPATRSREVREAVQAEVARVLPAGAADGMPMDAPLQELGMDSLMAVELRNALGRRAGRTLPATMAFDHPTASAIAGYLLDEVLVAPSPPPAPQPASEPHDDELWQALRAIPRGELRRSGLLDSLLRLAQRSPGGAAPEAPSVAASVDEMAIDDLVRQFGGDEGHDG